MLFAQSEFDDLYEMIHGFLAGLLATVVVSLATAEGAAEEVEAAILNRPFTRGGPA